MSNSIFSSMCAFFLGVCQRDSVLHTHLLNAEYQEDVKDAIALFFEDIVKPLCNSTFDRCTININIHDVCIETLYTNFCIFAFSKAFLTYM